MNNQYITSSAAARHIGVSRQYVSKQFIMGKIVGAFRNGENVMVPIEWAYLAKRRSEYLRYKRMERMNDTC